MPAARGCDCVVPTKLKMSACLICSSVHVCKCEFKSAMSLQGSVAKDKTHVLAKSAMSFHLKRGKRVSREGLGNQSFTMEQLFWMRAPSSKRRLSFDFICLRRLLSSFPRASWPSLLGVPPASECRHLSVDFPSITSSTQANLPI